MRLLNAARLDTGDIEVSLEATDVGRVVKRTLAAAAQESNGHQLVAEVDEPLAAHADPDKLRQVLDQLVSNAVKFSPAGARSSSPRAGRVMRSRSRSPTKGHGVPAAERERIFSKFYKAGDGQGRGTGLGLFIAQGLVQEMGGRIWVDSDEGQGARFAFVLPVAEDGVRFPTVEA